MSYTTFLLDLDHTLFDSDHSEAQAFSKTLRAAGASDSSRYMPTYQAINLDLWAAVERGELKPQQVRTLRFERLVAEADIDADPAQMADDFVAGLGANGDLYDGAHGVLQDLSEKGSLALVTNGLSEVQRERIKRLDIEKYFEAIIISAEINAAKPGREIFDTTFAALGQPKKSSALMVGDNLSSDIKGGANYGIATCWYNPQAKACPPDSGVAHEIRDLKDLLAFV